MEKANEVYDVVIVGSGLGGLLCATILGKEGYKVCVLEKNRQTGGCLQTFSRDKCIFDTGVHYVGGYGEGQPLYKLFKYFGIMDDLKLEAMDEDGFDRIVFAGDKKWYLYGIGYDKYIETLVKDFPEEEEAIIKYCDKIREICDMFPMYNLNDGNEDENLLNNMNMLSINTAQYLKELTPNIRLQGVLAATNVLYAGVEEKSPLYVHALIVNSYILSSHRFINGSSQVTKLLSKIIRNNNGTIINHANVKKFVVEGDLVTKVELANGKSIEGKNFISAIHPSTTLDMLETDKIRKAYKTRIKSLDNTIAAFILYLVMEKESFPYQKYNIYRYGTDNVWDAVNYTEENWGDSFALYYSANAKSDVYSDGIIVIAYMRNEEVEKWKHTYSTDSEKEYRGDDYEQFKKDKAEILLNKVEELYPDIRKHIKSYHTSTPLTFRDYIGMDEGSLYGILKDCENPTKSFIPVRTKVSNLLLTGQNLHMHGVYGVAIGALKTCSEILGQKYLMDKVHEANQEKSESL